MVNLLIYEHFLHTIYARFVACICKSDLEIVRLLRRTTCQIFLKNLLIWEVLLDHVGIWIIIPAFTIRRHYFHVTWIIYILSFSAHYLSRIFKLLERLCHIYMTTFRLFLFFTTYDSKISSTKLSCSSLSLFHVNLHQSFQCFLLSKLIMWHLKFCQDSVSTQTSLLLVESFALNLPFWSNFKQVICRSSLNSAETIHDRHRVSNLISIINLTTCTKTICEEMGLYSLRV